MRRILSGKKSNAAKCSSKDIQIPKENVVEDFLKDVEAHLRKNLSGQWVIEKLQSRIVAPHPVVAFKVAWLIHKICWEIPLEPHNISGFQPLINQLMRYWNKPMESPHYALVPGEDGREDECHFKLCLVEYLNYLSLRNEAILYLQDLLDGRWTLHQATLNRVQSENSQLYLMACERLTSLLYPLSSMLARFIGRKSSAFFCLFTLGLETGLFDGSRLLLTISQLIKELSHHRDNPRSQNTSELIISFLSRIQTSLYSFVSQFSSLLEIVAAFSRRYPSLNAASLEAKKPYSQARRNLQQFYDATGSPHQYLSSTTFNSLDARSISSRSLNSGCSSPHFGRSFEEHPRVASLTSDLKVQRTLSLEEPPMTLSKLIFEQPTQPERISVAQRVAQNPQVNSSPGINSTSADNANRHLHRSKGSLTPRRTELSPCTWHVKPTKHENLKDQVYREPIAPVKTNGSSCPPLVDQIPSKVFKDEGSRESQIKLLSNTSRSPGPDYSIQRMSSGYATEQATLSRRSAESAPFPNPLAVRSQQIITSNGSDISRFLLSPTRHVSSQSQWVTTADHQSKATVARKLSTTVKDDVRPVYVKAHHEASKQELVKQPNSPIKTISTITNTGKAAQRSDKKTNQGNQLMTLSDLEIDLNGIRIESLIGKGATSQVFKGIWRGALVAVKHIHVNKEEKGRTNTLKEFYRELGIMLRLRHPNLVLFMGANTRGNSLCVVTEYCAGGNLFEVLHGRKLKSTSDARSAKARLTWSQKLKICIDIARACQYLHTSNPPIIHRDLKSLNVLLTQAIESEKDVPVVKVSDFGLSRIKIGPEGTWGHLTGMAGTYHWMAPEVILTKPYCEKADVYSFGIVMFEVLSQTIPYTRLKENPSPVSIAIAVSKGLRPSLSRIPPGCPPTLIFVMQACWKVNPQERPSFSEIVEQLNLCGSV